MRPTGSRTRAVLAKSTDYSRRGQMALRGQDPPPVTNTRH